MKYLKKYKLFENLEDKIDLNELEDILIDFKQMDLDWDVNIGSSYIIDWDKLNNDIQGDLNQCYLHSGEISDYSKGIKNPGYANGFKSLNIDLLRDSQISFYNMDDFEEAYTMVSDYLNEKYNLKSNYIYINYHWTYLYFQNLEAVRTWALGGEYLGKNFIGHTDFRNINGFKAHRVTLGFI